MKYNFTILFLCLAIHSNAQFSVGLGLGNSNMRRVVPYSGSVKTYPVMLFASSDFNYQFKNYPINIGLSLSLFGSQHIEEPFASQHFKFIFCGYRQQQLYLGSLQYSWLQKRKIELYSGVALGLYTFMPYFGYQTFGVGSGQFVNWDKNGKRNFRGALGAQSGMIIGNKRLRTKIELRHVFFTQYEFAKLAREMNTSFSVGMLWVFGKRD